MNDTAASRSGPRTSRHSTLWSVLVPAAFVLAYVGARAGLERAAPGSPLALGLALLPLPFFAGLIFGYVRRVRAMDELARRIQLEALVFAYPIALLVVFTVGLLELAGFHGAHDWDLPRLWPLLLLPYWFGVVLARRKYQ